ncbi:MAG: hypothetical protein ACOX81_04855 [Candidatus Heteroscillospira sp.]|jgi:hypothetical protein
MREEQVTKALLRWLTSCGWEIVCFDFPQSGTGRLLHPNGSEEKNRDAINPDIVAVRAGKCVFFENKDRFYRPDYLKQNKLIECNNYTDAIGKLLESYTVESIYYGIGLPLEKHGGSSEKAAELVDFIAGVKRDGSVWIVHSRQDDIFD